MLNDSAPGRKLRLQARICHRMPRGFPMTKHKILYLLYLPYKWLILVPMIAVSTAFFAALAITLATVVSPRAGSTVGGTAWARLIAWLTPMWVTVVGRELVDHRQSYVIVANHLSIYDIFVLYGWLGLDFKWVLKQELRKMPALGISCEKLGHVFVDRSDAEAATRSINAAKQRVGNGTSVVFFAEGTRSGDGNLQRFKKGAFRMAIALGLPILPVTITGTREIMPPQTLRVFPGRAGRIFHPPVDIAGLGRLDVGPLTRRVRAMIESGLEDQRG